MTDEPKLTDEEHHARAMLMNLDYLNWAHAYVGRDVLIGSGLVRTWIDASTMQPLDLDEVRRRIISRKGWLAK